jgi:hypothetical protein
VTEGRSDVLEEKRENEAFTRQEERAKALEDVMFMRALSGNCPKYAQSVPVKYLIQILCKGQCNSQRWAALNKPYPGKLDLQTAKKGEYKATCLKCGYVAVDNHNWHRTISEHNHT